LAVGSRPAQLVELTHEGDPSVSLLVPAPPLSTMNPISRGYAPQFPRTPQITVDRFDVRGGPQVIRSQNRDGSVHRYVVSSSDRDDRWTEPPYVSAHQLYATLTTPYPLLTSPTPVVAQPTACEITSIWNAVGYARDVAKAGLNGPTTMLNEIPAGRR
jgi:hypothetical protein